MRSRSAPALTALQQLINLKLSPICEGYGAVRLGRLTWHCAAQPEPLARVYPPRIEYQQGCAPEVYVVQPHLSQRADGRKLPHVYAQDPARLCLYLPGTGEWSQSKRISETIVPWSLLWLWYFE